jgi:hypothetical protein
VLLAVFPLYSDDTPQYEYWGDDYFTNPNRDSMEIIPPIELSAGFFPKIAYSLTFSFIQESNGWDYSSGSFFVNDIFSKNQNPFFAQVGSNDILDAMTEKKSFSDKNKYGWFSSDQSRDNFDIGIRLEYPFPTLRTAITANLGVKTRYITAYSTVRTGEYMYYNGKKQTLDQLSFAEINDQHIYFDVMLKHPLYGFSLNSILSNGQMKSTMSIFYYLIYGIGIDYSYLDKINIYEYILSNQDVIRFTNGEIREPSVFKQNFDRVDKIRYYYNVGLGWQMSFNNTIANYELLYKQSVNPIIKNSDYRHSILIFRIGLNMYSIKNIAMLCYNIFFK